MTPETRRDFLKQFLLLASGSSGAGAFTATISDALAIDPLPGTTFLDAEHVVILMQENRSFDHVYGTLRGVRGFNDPRAITLPDGLPVWFQTDPTGDTYAPFRLDLHGSKATWMSCLPHSWTDQAAARNGGRHDRWLIAKPSGVKAYASLPLTLGYYDRRDLPFHYALADAFTVCDQAFCSSLTGTTANRLHLWTGTIRPDRQASSKAHVHNGDTDYDHEVSWTTFPERLEKAGISWRVYQNELSLPSGLGRDEDPWLANFTDNPLEWFQQFHVRFSASHRAWLEKREGQLTALLAKLEAKPSGPGDPKLAETRAELEQIRRDRVTYTAENFAKIPAHEQALHHRAFTTNTGDPAYRRLTSLSWQEEGTTRLMKVPAGDVLHQFREDAAAGRLPAVSWLVPPQHFSDHPDSPWYGSWYAAEVLAILTKNPAVWQKTILILCYDENDGCFDHVPPFTAPLPDQPGTGAASPGLETALEHVTDGSPPGPIGLGYRVPLVIASPWSRGGRVCSQVFDHTSIVQFLEVFLSHKTGQPLRETNLTAWRRAVCGDLTSSFQPWRDEAVGLPAPVDRHSLLTSIHAAQFKPLPDGFRKLAPGELAMARRDARSFPGMPRQEPGTRPSCALPYELSVEGALEPDRRGFRMRLAAGNQRFGARSAGAAYHVYTPARVRPADPAAGDFTAGRAWAFTAAPGTEVEGHWLLTDFSPAGYDLRVLGPNGFGREFTGDASDPLLTIQLEPEAAPSPALRLRVTLLETGRPVTLRVEDLSYQSAARTARLTVGSPVEFAWNLAASCGWHDLRVTVEEAPRFSQRFSGRLETGLDSVSDPRMAG